MPDPKPIFDMGKFLDSKGITFAGIDDAGNYNVIGQDGREGTVDVQAMTKAMGIDTSKMDVELNTPDSAQDSSPVGIIDRARLALGNTRGQIGYLKQKFEDAGFVEGKGLVVRDRGVWRRVDQSHMDPYELTKDIVEGAVGILPGAAAATYGAAQGAAIGGPAAPITAAVGGIAGAAAGGAVAETARSSLGRWAGTYDATPMEQLRDVGFEALLNAGGQTIALGVKPALSMLGKAVKGITDKAAPAAKEAIVDVIGRTTGAGSTATGVMFDQTDEVLKELGSAGAGKLTTSEVQTALRQGQIEAVDKLVEETPAALSRQFGKLSSKLASEVPASFKSDIGGMIQEAASELEAKGWGQVIDATDQSGKSVFKLLSNEEGLARVIKGMDGQVISEEARGALHDLTKTVNQFINAGSASGEEAARGLMKIKAVVNQTARDLGTNVPPSVSRFVNDFRGAVVNQIGKEFDRAGVKESYLATANLYEKYAAAANLARRIAGSENGSEVLLNKLLQGAGRNQVYQDLAGDMASLVGDSGKAALNSIMTKEAAKGFAPMLPKLTFGNVSLASGGLGGLAAAGNVALGMKAAALAAPIASPRLVLKQVQYGKQFLSFLQGMSPGARAQWLRNPQLVQAAIREVAKAPYDEDATTQQMLGQAGIRR